MSLNLMNVRCKMLLYSIRKYSTKPNYVLIYQQFNFCIRVIFHINHFIQLHDIFFIKITRYQSTRETKIYHTLDSRPYCKNYCNVKHGFVLLNTFISGTMRRSHCNIKSKQGLVLLYYI